MRHTYNLHKQKTKSLLKNCAEKTVMGLVAMSLAFGPVAGLLTPQAVQAAPGDAQIRVHQKPDLDSDGVMSWTEAGQHEPGWTIRLYNDAFAPQPYGDGGSNEVVTTAAPYDAAAVFNVPPTQNYVICEVLKDGYTPSFQATINGWVDYTYATVPNGSSASDEGANCIAVNGVVADEIRSFAFGDRPNHSVPAAAEQTEEVVVPSEFANSPDTWTYHDDTVSPLVAATPTETEEHKIDENPEMSTGDYGAVRLMVEPGDKWNLATVQYSGLMLADISEMGFSVYTSDPGQAYLNFDVDFDNTAPSTVGFQGRLVYVPNPAPVANTWQSYEAIDNGAGVWTWSRFDENGNQWPDGNTNPNRTWEEIVTAFPNAEISIVESAFDFGGLYLRADGDGGDSTTFYDYVYVATPTENILYNFEPEDLPDGEIRIHAVNDVDEDGQPDWTEGESHEAGWEMRLYDSTWGLVDTVSTTGLVFDDSAKFNVQPGVYYVCELLQDGYSYSFGRTITSWVTWPDASTLNLSGDTDEAGSCIEVEVFPGQFSSHVFGNVPPAEVVVDEETTGPEDTPPVTDTTGTTPPQTLATTTQFTGVTNNAGVLGTNDGTDGTTGDEENDDTGTLSNFSNGDNTPEVLAAQDEADSFFANWWWLLLFLIPAFLWFLWSLLRRDEDDQVQSNL